MKSEMEKFLSTCKKNLDNLDSFAKVHVVLGNESCDLDSAVSTIVTAYLLHELQPVSNVLVLPVLNVCKKDIKLRTEITYFFEQVDLSFDIMVYRDDIDLKKLHSQNKLSLTLVDHNLLPQEDAELQCAVKEIIDHHRLETSHRCDKTVEMVGSCSTLVAEKVLHSKADLIDPQIALLLFGTILLDTVCLSESARKATPKDRNVISKLQELLPEVTQEEVFKSLQTSKNNVSGLTLDELLRRDLKAVSTATKHIAISSIPGEIKSLGQQNGIEGKLGQFCKDHGYNALVVLSVKLDEKCNGVQRGLAVFSYDVLLRQQITSALMAVAEPCLELELCGLSTDNFISFAQKNCHASRKVVLPVIRKFLLSLEDNVLPKASDQPVTNGIPSGERLTMASNQSPDDFTLSEQPLSPQNSSSSASETAKDGGAEKHEDSSVLADPFPEHPSLYKAQTVDFPECPQHTKSGQTRLGSVGLDDDTDDDILSRGDQPSISEMKRGTKSCSGDSDIQHLSLASDVEEYFEDSFATQGLKVYNEKQHTGRTFSSVNSDCPDVSSGLSEENVPNVSEDSVDCHFESPHTDRVSPMFSTPVHSPSGCTEDKRGGFLFKEKASGEGPDPELVKKVMRCFDEDKIKGIYSFTCHLDDILSPDEVNEILDNHSAYSGYIDDSIFEALSIIRSDVSCDSNARASETNGKEVVPLASSIRDVLEDIGFKATCDAPGKDCIKAENEATGTDDTGDQQQQQQDEQMKTQDELNNSRLNLTKIDAPVSLLLEGYSASTTDSSDLPDHSALTIDLPHSVPQSLDEASVFAHPERNLRAEGSRNVPENCQRDNIAVDDGLSQVDSHTLQKAERPSTLSGGDGRKRKIKVNPDILHSSIGFDDDQKSLSSISNRSDCGVSSPVDGLSTPDIDTPDEMDDSVLERDDSTLSEPIPELSAMEEFQEERSWRTCTVGGLERKVDMKVIEPYKKVLSHGGYFGEDRHAIIVFSACYLPDRSRKDYDYVMDNLFLYVLTTLDQLVAEDYVLIYLHGATERSAMPSFGWLKRCYQMIDRRLRKNLKGLYLVHPTFWVKTIVIMTRPFISSKFYRKLAFVNSLEELGGLVPMEYVCIPDKVKQFDAERLLEG
ncbi:uncharacterized protein LOC135385596 isoform X2 [Ornithodoros turicata]|uniref:uncharacterized protein LOC135385596 isoform X2 n=1 Tax=Ornithodoros turicata TaxID=34597 RepID=UPI003139D173